MCARNQSQRKKEKEKKKKEKMKHQIILIIFLLIGLASMAIAALVGTVDVQNSNVVAGWFVSLSPFISSICFNEFSFFRACEENKNKVLSVDVYDGRADIGSFLFNVPGFFFFVVVVFGWCLDSFSKEIR